MVAITRTALARQLPSQNTTRTVISSAVRKKYTKKKKRTVKQRTSSSKKRTVKQHTSSSTTSPPLQPYNEVAGKSNIIDANGYDRYGNPTEREYDLGRDGAFMGFNILIGQFYYFDMQQPIDALKIKGFQVKHVMAEDECMTELASNRYQIAWIISSTQIQNSKFISALTAFHSAGGAIFLFADNTPYVCHASEFLRKKFGITVEGDYYGEKTMTYKENGHLQTGNFGQHEIFTGITNLFEGSTICHPVYSTPESRTIFVTIATATDGNSSIAVYDPPSTSTEGRLCLDCGFTKLYYKWDSAGTARYVVNASCWLLGIKNV
ncbi:unnamed protein product [Rotaria sordida]|uniref:Uncharacterized protein n=2 Tax=Rotaria sordida TaxID=392033 RepID=A0A815PZD0_9BILA|nr:unnamed protein product [Rotaria sordida]CAF3921639.1 unnamed protein product [Rotaria sordida]